MTAHPNQMSSPWGERRGGESENSGRISVRPANNKRNPPPCRCCSRRRRRRGSCRRRTTLARSRRTQPHRRSYCRCPPTPPGASRRCWAPRCPSSCPSSRRRAPACSGGTSALRRTPTCRSTMTGSVQCTEFSPRDDGRVRFPPPQPKSQPTHRPVEVHRRRHRSIRVRAVVVVVGCRRSSCCRGEMLVVVVVEQLSLSRV